MSKSVTVALVAASAFAWGCGSSDHPGRMPPKPKATARHVISSADEEWLNGPNQGNADLVPVDELRGAETFELISLEPSEETPPTPDEIDEWSVIGRLSIADSDTREKLIEALVQAALDNPGEQAACFCPRHAIRVTSRGKLTEIVICFECLSAEIYTGGVRGEVFLVTETPRSLFNDTLSDAGVALAQPECD